MENANRCQESRHLTPMPFEDINAPLFVTPDGTMKLVLTSGIIVEITLDKSIRISKDKMNLVIALNGKSAYLKHPLGDMYQHDREVEFQCYKRNRKVRVLGLHHHTSYFSMTLGTEWYTTITPFICILNYAKMWKEGIYFWFTGGKGIYLMDAEGVKKTRKINTNMNVDHSWKILLERARHGPQYAQEAMYLLQTGSYYIDRCQAHNWIFNDVWMTQNAKGLFRLSSPNQEIVNINPELGHISVTSGQSNTYTSIKLRQSYSSMYVKIHGTSVFHTTSRFVLNTMGHLATLDRNVDNILHKHF